MEQQNFRLVVAEEDHGKRLDKFLVEKLPKEISRAFIQKLILDKSILLNKESFRNSHSVKTGDIIEVTIPEPKLTHLEAEDIDIDVTYEDDNILIVNKENDMVVHPAPGNYSGTLVNALLAHCDDLSGIGGVSKPGIVHRLDKGTTGLLVVAKTDKAHRSLSKQFKNKTVKKIYVALVRGIVQLDNGIVKLPIGRDKKDRKKMAVDIEDGKDAITQYKVVERFKSSTLLEVTLLTGRTHQIRVHMAYMGHPIIGDERYGAKKDEYKRPMLHAKTIGFTHPITGKYVEFTSDLPKDMKKAIKAAKAEGKIK